MTALVVAEGVAIALLGILVLGLLRNQGRILEILGEREPASDRQLTTTLRVGFGGPAPQVAGVTPGGEAAEVDVASGSVLLAFLTEGCRECARWWEVLGNGQGHLLGPLLAVVTPSPATERAGALARVAPPGLPVIMSSEAWETYGVTMASTFVLVNDGRLVAAGRATTWDELAAIVSQSPGLTGGT